jgi:outer membrane biosynthesis protein TonB
MTFRRALNLIRTREGIAVSVLLHLCLLGWGLFAFTSRSLEAPLEDVVPVDIISEDNVAKAKAGMKTGDKDQPKPMADKVAAAKPVDEAVGKVTEKEPIVTDSTPPPQPKPVEKKPDPPKPVTETKPKEEPKQAEKKPDPPNDQIADALKQEEAKKPKPKPEAKTPPPPQYKPKERVFDPNAISKQIAMNQDKRDPTRQTLTGEAINPLSSYGMRSGTADSNVATWKGAFATAVRRCFSFPYNGQDADQFSADIDIQMRPDGKVAADPVIVEVHGPSRSIATAMAESAKRAILNCQAYAFLPREQYNSWKYIQLTFELKDLL